MGEDQSRSDETNAPAIPSRFHASFGEIELHVEGSEAFIERTVNEFQPALRALATQKNGDPILEARKHGLMRTADADITPYTSPQDQLSPEARIEQWYGDRVTVPEGKRGMLQDHALLFIYYFTNVLRRPSATTQDIRWGFETLDIGEPNVAVLMHTLKKKRMAEPAKEYAAYTLTQPGRDYVEQRFDLVLRR